MFLCFRFRSLILSPNIIWVASRAIWILQTLETNGTVREAVASDPSAIGYVSIGLVNDKVKALAWNGVVATNADVINGTYPLSRPIYFLTKGEPAPHVRAFIEYVLSPAGQGILTAEGLIAVK